MDPLLILAQCHVDMIHGSLPRNGHVLLHGVFRTSDRPIAYSHCQDLDVSGRSCMIPAPSMTLAQHLMTETSILRVGSVRTWDLYDPAL